LLLTRHGIVLQCAGDRQSISGIVLCSHCPQSQTGITGINEPCILPFNNPAAVFTHSSGLFQYPVPAGC
jgi:hypothetical protein